MVKQIYSLKNRVALWQSYFYQKTVEEVVTLEYVYKILLNFSELFDIIDEDQCKKLFQSYTIETLVVLTRERDL